MRACPARPGLLDWKMKYMGVTAAASAAVADAVSGKHGAFHSFLFFPPCFRRRPLSCLMLYIELLRLS